MTAQLKNQDPFNPVDNTQMVAQMAQFSSLSGITEMSTTLKTIAAKLTGTSTSDAMSYVGKTVLTEGDTAFARTTGGIAGAVELDGDATDVNVTIQDANGATLKTMNLGQTQPRARPSSTGTAPPTAAQPPAPARSRSSSPRPTAARPSPRARWSGRRSRRSPTCPAAAPLNVAGLGAIAISAVRQVG